MQKKFYFITELSEILGISVASIQAHLARKRFDSVPAPVKLGRRLAWPVAVVDAFIDDKIKACQRLQEAKPESALLTVAPRKKIGRPTKREALRKSKEIAHE